MGRIVGQPDIKVDYDTLQNVADFIPIYHDDEDVFFLRPEQPKSAVSLDWNGDVWLRIDPNSGEIVGVEIDDFESVFLKKYPDLASAWKQAKPLCYRKRKTEPDKIYWQAFITIILDFVQNLTRQKPQQAQFAV